MELVWTSYSLPEWGFSCSLNSLVLIYVHTLSMMLVIQHFLGKGCCTIQVINVRKWWEPHMLPSLYSSLEHSWELWGTLWTLGNVVNINCCNHPIFIYFEEIEFFSNTCSLYAKDLPAHSRFLLFSFACSLLNFSFPVVRSGSCTTYWLGSSFLARCVAKKYFTQVGHTHNRRSHTLRTDNYNYFRMVHQLSYPRLFSQFNRKLQIVLKIK